MSISLTVAGLAAIVAAIGHSVTGEIQVLRALRELAPSTLTSHIQLAWHLAAIAWLGIGAVFLLAAHSTVDAGTHRAVRHLAVALAVSAVAVLGLTRGKNPAAYLFAVSAVAAWLGV
jgi:membrane-associated PAP2 superfamily phosphatase